MMASISIEEMGNTAYRSGEIIGVRQEDDTEVVRGRTIEARTLHDQHARLRLIAVNRFDRRQHDVALVGFDEIPLVDLLEPAVTTVEQDVEAIATDAAELLFRRLDGDNGPSERVIVPTSLSQRGSGEIPGPLSSAAG